MKPDGFRYGQDAWIYFPYAIAPQRVFVASKAPPERIWKSGGWGLGAPRVVCHEYETHGKMNPFGFLIKRSELFKSEADALEAQSKFLLSWSEDRRAAALENERKALRCEMRAAELRAKEANQ